jgi:hypothetical protein
MRSKDKHSKRGRMVTTSLLTREEFRKAVFQRDNHQCVFCGEPAVDAHHIIERRLWGDGGYYVDNGASACGKCHVLCEKTELSVEETREKAGITNIILPFSLEAGQKYDKWGNQILPSGRRLRGELYDDVSVQRILEDKLHLFTKYIKYPKTPHLPYSEGANQDDDTILTTTHHFKGKNVVVTTKMDGENTTLYDDYYHARSITGDSHISQSWVRGFHGRLKANIPSGYAERTYTQSTPFHTPICPHTSWGSRYGMRKTTASVGSERFISLPN